MVISLLIPIIIIVLMIAVVVMVVLGIKSGIESDEGGETMIKHVYVYLVLFATLMMTIGGSVSAFMATADLIAPAPYYQSFEDFKRWGNEKDYEEKDVKDEEGPSEAELRDRYDQMVIEEKEKQINQAKNALIKSFGWILIPLGIFIYFQRHLVKIKA